MVSNHLIIGFKSVLWQRIQFEIIFIFYFCFYLTDELDSHEEHKRV